MKKTNELNVEQEVSYSAAELAEGGEEKAEAIQNKELKKNVLDLFNLLRETARVQEYPSIADFIKAENIISITVHADRELEVYRSY